MKRIRVLIVIVFLLDSLVGMAQEVDSVIVDNSLVWDSIESPVTEIPSFTGKEVFPDSVRARSEFKPDPNKAVLYSAIFPGLGQIYNRKYWKLPIVYGGFLGCAYAISWNGTMYSDYKKAFHDIMSDDPAEDSWKDFLRYGTNPDDFTESDKRWLTNALRNKRDFYRRNRDLSIFATIGVYAICMIDAYVDAQLFDFDISPDLSVRIDPVIFNRTSISSGTVGLQCSINF